MVELAIKEMKNKKASDRYRWIAERIKNGGERDEQRINSAI